MKICLTSTPAWINNFIHYKMWNEITYPFPNFNGVEIWELTDDYFHLTLNWTCDYLIRLGLKLNHVSKRSPYFLRCVYKIFISRFSAAHGQRVNMYGCTVCSLQWRHNGHNGISSLQPHDCLHNRLFRHRSKKTSKLRVTGYCEGNSPVTGEFPAQRTSNAENVSIWWRHHLHGMHCKATGIYEAHNVFVWP